MPTFRTFTGKKLKVHKSTIKTFFGPKPKVSKFIVPMMPTDTKREKGQAYTYKPTMSNPISYQFIPTESFVVLC